MEQAIGINVSEHLVIKRRRFQILNSCVGDNGIVKNGTRLGRAHLVVLWRVIDVDFELSRHDGQRVVLPESFLLHLNWHLGQAVAMR